jgi:hypothetical protein
MMKKALAEAKNGNKANREVNIIVGVVVVIDRSS